MIIFSFWKMKNLVLIGINKNISKLSDCVLCLQECEGMEGIKDSRVLWLGNTDKIISAGFSQVRILLSLGERVFWKHETFLNYSFNSLAAVKLLLGMWKIYAVHYRGWALIHHLGKWTQSLLPFLTFLAFFLKNQIWNLRW